MELVFTKGAGKHDTLDLIGADGQTRIDCPKQRIMPHDMVHYAVERTLTARGFLARVAQGEAAAATMAGDAESDAVERLVETFQGDGWSGGSTSSAALIDLYHVTCAARGCPALAIDTAAVAAVRAEIVALTARWDLVPVGGTLRLVLPAQDT